MHDKEFITFLIETHSHRKLKHIEHNKPLTENSHSFGFDNVNFVHSVVLALSLSRHTEVTSI